MANPVVQITIYPFSDPFVSPSGGGTTSISTLLPYDVDQVKNPVKRITVARPTGPKTASGSPPLTYKQGKITISDKGQVKLDLVVVDNADSPASYTVCGVAFSLSAAGVEYLARQAAAGVDVSKAPGRDNFTDFSCNPDGSVTLNDADVLAGTNNYEFLLLIQNSLGGMAIVDPQITNTN